jgi:hypothetical protein
MNIASAGAAVVVLVFGAAPGAAKAADGSVFRIEHAAARVIVIPEARRDVSFTIRQGRKDLPPIRAVRDGALVVVKGEMGFGPMHLFEGFNCHGAGGGASVGIFGHGRVPIADLPVVTVRTPMRFKVQAGGAIYGEAAQSEAFELGASGCGAWRVGDVKGRLTISISGPADVKTATAGEATIGLSGTGDVSLGAVRSLDVDVSGMGNVRAASARDAKIGVSGTGNVVLGAVDSLDAEIAGMGDVRAASAHDAKIGVSGSGAVFLGAVGSLEAQISGMGEVHVASAGDAKIGVSGSGNVIVGPVRSLDAHIWGSGDIRVGAVQGPIEANISGSGNIEVASTSGQVFRRGGGSGKVTVKGR